MSRGRIASEAAAISIYQDVLGIVIFSEPLAEVPWDGKLDGETIELKEDEE